LPQEASIFRGLNVEDNIRAVLEIIEPDKRKRAAQLEALLDEFDLARLRKAPSIALSGGERRRCEIARALAGRPSFMLLDEPFAGIDPIAVGDIQRLVQHLKRRGIGILITDHNVRETLGLVDRAYIIHSGRVLVEGKPAEIVADANVRQFYLGEGFRL
jgi:lipopolysaccharide export system ATP-binding protein